MTSCMVCGWRPRARGKRCDSCRQFHRRHGRDRTTEEVMANWSWTMDQKVGFAVAYIPEKPAHASGPVTKTRVALDRLDEHLAARGITSA